MTPHLAMVVDERQRISQHTNHGQHHQGLGALLLDRGFFEMAVGGDGLKHLGIDPPAAAS
jgi:hypothetical protein